ncbi:MAG: hypothetical protein LUG62_07845 [Clostridiales bacterium]|nr:hypothetical protein [Clostridiales bacterium]
MDRYKKERSQSYIGDSPGMSGNHSYDNGRRNFVDTHGITGDWAFFLLLGIVSGGSLGIGDGLLLLVLAAVLEPEEFLGLLFWGLAACGAVGAVRLLVLREERKAEMPFVPFLTVAYLGRLFLR